MANASIASCLSVKYTLIVMLNLASQRIFATDPVYGCGVRALGAQHFHFLSVFSGNCFILATLCCRAIFFFLAPRRQEWGRTEERGGPLLSPASPPSDGERECNSCGFASFAAYCAFFDRQITSGFRYFATKKILEHAKIPPPPYGHPLPSGTCLA